MRINYLPKNNQNRLRLTLKMAFPSLYYIGELPTSIKKNCECFIDVVFVFFLVKGECKLGKAFPQVYRERAFDLYHPGSTQRQISQDMRVSIGYVNKVVRFNEQIK